MMLKEGCRGKEEEGVTREKRKKKKTNFSRLHSVLSRENLSGGRGGGR